MRMRTPLERDIFGERTRIRSVSVSGDVATLDLADGSSLDETVHPRIVAALASDRGFESRWTVLDDGHALAFDVTPDLDVHSVLYKRLIDAYGDSAAYDGPADELFRRMAGLLQVLESEGFAGILERGETSSVVEDLDRIGAFTASATLRRAVQESAASSDREDVSGLDDEGDPAYRGPLPPCEVDAFSRDVIRSLVIVFEP